MSKRKRQSNSIAFREPQILVVQEMEFVQLWKEGLGWQGVTAPCCFQSLPWQGLFRALKGNEGKHFILFVWGRGDQQEVGQVFGLVVETHVPPEMCGRSAPAAH